MLNNFNSSVLQIATIILIIILIIVGMFMYYLSYTAIYPPVISECPDYWDVVKDSNNKISCENKLKINPNAVSNTDSCNKVNPVNFSGSTDEDTICNKYNWARNCNVVWDGVTNSNAKCVK